MAGWYFQLLRVDHYTITGKVTNSKQKTNQFIKKGVHRVGAMRKCSRISGTPFFCVLHFELEM